MMTDDALNSLRGYLTGSIAYAQYRADGTYYKADIESRGEMSDGRVYVEFIIDYAKVGSATVTEVQLFDKQDTLWASKKENITREDASDGLPYRVMFMVDEVFDTADS